MKLKWIFLSISIVAFFSTVNSQVNTFNKGFIFLDSLAHESVSQVIELEDGYMLSGYSDLNDCKLVIAKINLSGERLWQKHYGNDQIHFRPGFGDSMTETSDSNFALAITYTDTLNEPEDRLMIIKFDKEGDTLWSRIVYYPDSVNEYCSAGGIIETYDRGFLIHGGEGGLTSVLVKTDSLGNHEWNTYYGFHSLTNRKGIHCICQTSDSGYIAGGYQINPGDVKSGDPRIVRFLKDGTRTWDRNIGGPYYDYSNTQVQPAGDGNFMVITHYTTGTSGNPYYHPEKSKLHIVKISENNEILSDVLIGDEGEYLYASDLEVLGDGSLISSGRDIWGSISWLYNFSLERDSLYFRMVFPPERIDITRTLRDVKSCRDGGIISCGDYYTNVRHPWIIKTDRFACLDMGCDTNGIYLIQQPVPVTTCKNLPASIELATYNSGDNVLYNWQHFIDGAWQNIEDEIVYQGFDEDTLLINSSFITNQQEFYRCNFYNDYWSFYSDSVMVNFLDTISIVLQPQSQSLHYGEAANISIGINGFRPINYQWFHLDQLLEEEQDSVLHIQHVTETDTGTYFCRMTNDCGESESEHVYLKIDNLGIDDETDKLKISIHPNPTEGMLNIWVQEEVLPGNIRLLDLSGRPISVVVHHAGNSDFKLDLTAISPGMYFLVIQFDSKQVLARRIIKK